MVGLRNFCLGNVEEQKTRIVNRFVFISENIGDEDKDKDHLIDTQARQSMKLLYDSSSLETFWCNVHIEYPTLAKRPQQVLIPFATTWLCKLGFSSLLYFKNKCRNA